MPGIGTLQFRNNNPFDTDFRFEVYVHDKALFLERPILFNLTRKSNIDFVSFRKVLKVF